RVSDDAGRPDQALAQQGNRRQQNARRITAWRRDERRVLDLRAIGFRETVNRFLGQVGRGMVVRVELFVSRRVLHAEIGAQIDDLATELEEGNGVFRGDTVGQGEEDRLGLLGEQLGVWLREA